MDSMQLFYAFSPNKKRKLVDVYNDIIGCEYNKPAHRAYNDVDMMV
jgi:hypothetical protein